MSISFPFALISSSALRITVKVFSPKKSNLTRPIASECFIENCVAGISERGSRYNGTNSCNGLSPITMPAACVEACRYKPSNFEAMLNIFLTKESSDIALLISSIFFCASTKVIGRAGSNGTSLQILSTFPYGICKTLPTSLKAARACKVPKVII